MENTIANNKNIKRPKPVILVILDGWGVSQPFAGNAITQANTKTINTLIANYPSTTIMASGDSVGLPWGEEGNSEVGHLNLGLGRILYQDLPRINKSISDGNFYNNPVLLRALEHVKKNNSKMHFIGLISDGCVHSSVDHLYALMIFAKNANLKEYYIHAFLDGRDTSYNAGVNFIKGVERNLKKFGTGAIASISGRFYAMDRNNNWDRTAKTYSALTESIGNRSEDAISAIEQSYKKKIYDEEFVPTVITKNGEPVSAINDNDAVIFFNYRPDRGRQLTKAFVFPEFQKFSRNKFLNNLFFATFTEYEKGLPVEIVFPPEEIKNTLGEVLSTAGLKQLRIAETEKYAHVTYFFNGGREEKSAGEDHILIPSPAVQTYDLKPEMSALEITKKLLEVIKDDKYDFILVNFANADMVGHSGNMDASIKAVETIDKCLDKIVKSVLAKDGLMIITADHGNAEIMFNMQTGQIDKEHSSNPVPFIIVSKEYVGKTFGWQNAPTADLSLVQPQGILSDVAPTVLKIFGLKKPKEMLGVSLI
jgi:2,3-bisphosphoglycerate-independent phosphoglycerate mutase